MPSLPSPAPSRLHQVTRDPSSFTAACQALRTRAASHRLASEGDWLQFRAPFVKNPRGRATAGPRKSCKRGPSGRGPAALAPQLRGRAVSMHLGIPRARGHPEEFQASVDGIKIPFPSRSALRPLTEMIREGRKDEAFPLWRD